MTPRRVGEAGVGSDGDGDEGVPSGAGRLQLPSWGLGGGDQGAEDGGVEHWGAAGVGVDGDGKGAVPSGTGRPRLPTWGLGGGNRRAEDGDVENRGDIIGEAALDVESDPDDKDPLSGDGASVTGKPR